MFTKLVSTILRSNAVRSTGCTNFSNPTAVFRLMEQEELLTIYLQALGMVPADKAEDAEEAA